MKTNGRHLSAQAQEDLRRRVVHAVAEQGMGPVEASRVFGVGRTSIHTWMKAYTAGGSSALKARKRGPKPRSRLAGHEAATIVRIVEDRCPDQLRLPFALWTREAVQQLIAQRTGVQVSVWTVGRYLRHWGFTPQKPLRRAYEQDAAAVRQWLNEEYPTIRKQAKAAKSEIYWGDEMGLRSDHQVGTSYGRRGQTPTIPGTGKRFGCNMISAITNRGHLLFMVFKRRFTAKVLVEFLNRLARQVGRLFLILDGHPVHRSASVKRWLAEHPQLKLFFLPGYSPKLNPDELLNQDVKSNAVGRQRPATQEDMVGTVRSYLRSTQKQPHIVQHYFQQKDVLYAAI
jgi:transposase